MEQKINTVDDDGVKALRFISAYNAVDNALRSIYNFKRNMNYSDMIRRCAGLNQVVRKYEDKLIDYGRLRNAIVHSSIEDVIIAEPHESVLLEFEKIARLITTPPRALQTIATQTVEVIEGNTLVKEVMKMIFTSGYKNIPVYTDGKLIGIANASKILEELGHQAFEGNDLEKFVSRERIGSIIKSDTVENYYMVCNKDVTVEEVLELFYKNRKLLVVLITANGNFLDKPLGIVTVADIMDMNKIMDMY